MNELRMIADYVCHTGEGALWHLGERRLYWLDIPRGRLFRWDPAAGEHRLCLESNRPIGALTGQADGSLLLWQDHGLVTRWHGGEPETVIRSIHGHEGCRFNDAIADPEGRVFAGMMNGSTQGRDALWRIDHDGHATRVLDGIGRTNGLGFSPDLRYLYYADTHARTVTRYDYDCATGALSGGKVLITVEGVAGGPDGMTVDAEGGLWVAVWGGGCVLRYTSDGRPVGRIDVPTPRASCVAFGGEGLRQLFITTAGGHEKEKLGPQAGALFAVKSDVAGREEFVSRILLD